MLKHPSRLSPDASKRLKESWNSQYAEAENAHKTAVLEEGMDLISVGMTAEQAQFLETRKFQRNEIAAIFGVPPHKIGDLERATFSNIEHQAIEVVTDTIRPWAPHQSGAAKPPRKHGSSARSVANTKLRREEGDQRPNRPVCPAVRHRRRSASSLRCPEGFQRSRAECGH